VPHQPIFHPFSVIVTLTVMASTKPLVLGAALILLAFTTLAIFRPRSSALHPITTPAKAPRAPECGGFSGSSDFYGLGIRIGVYPQWFSAWLSNTPNPSGAAINHDANAIFLLAVLIALTLALAVHSLQPVEAYIMTLLSTGFIFSVLSFLGIRLYFLQPTALRTFFRGIASAWSQRRKTSAPKLPNYLPITTLPVLFLSTFKAAMWRATFSAASGVKHPALSWAGVVARATISSFVAVLNIWLWFIPSIRQPVDGSCGNFVYFFGRKELAGSLMLFLKVASIITALPIFYLFVACISLASRLLVLIRDCFSRHALITILEKVRHGHWDSLSDEEKQELGFLATASTSSIYSSSLTRSGVSALVGRYIALIRTVHKVAFSTGKEADTLGPRKVMETASRHSGTAPHNDFWSITAGELPSLSVLAQGVTNF
jgi:hypothetical protein